MPSLAVNEPVSEVEELRQRIAQLEAENADMRALLAVSGDSYWRRIADSYRVRLKGLLETTETVSMQLNHALGNALRDLEQGLLNAKRKDS